MVSSVRLASNRESLSGHSSFSYCLVGIAIDGAPNHQKWPSRGLLASAFAVKATHTSNEEGNKSRSS